jgi:simple sugar transport system ATP-binding protein
VHQLLLDAATEGVGVLLVSEDLDEVLALADRVVVMYEGSVTGVVDASDATIASLGVLMGGGSSEEGT